MQVTPEADWWLMPASAICRQSEQDARDRQAQLTKPPGALGELEALAVRLAGLQGTQRPTVDNVHITVFAGDHGIAVEGVSAFPQCVTEQMVRNFAQGGAAICVLARQLGARLEVVNLGTVSDTGALPGVHHYRLGPGTANFMRSVAMSSVQARTAMSVGAASAERALAEDCQLFVGGEMGIGNTAAATALASLTLAQPVSELVGAGTGLDKAGLTHKTAILENALKLHRKEGQDVLSVLCAVGGFEIAALMGAYLRCSQIGLPALVDGFIASVAALLAMRLRADVMPWLFFGHQSAEAGHQRVLAAMQVRPLLHLGMRLGEGSGAAVAVPLLRLACALHNDMATFAEAAVSGRVADL